MVVFLAFTSGLFCSQFINRYTIKITYCLGQHEKPLPLCELMVESSLRRHHLLYSPEECAERATACSERQLEYLQWHAVERLSCLPLETLAGLVEQYSLLDSLSARFRTNTASFRQQLSTDSCGTTAAFGQSSSHTSSQYARFNNPYVASIAARATMFVSDVPIRDFAKAAAPKLEFRPMTTPRSLQLFYEVFVCLLSN